MQRDQNCASQKERPERADFFVETGSRDKAVAHDPAAEAFFSSSLKAVGGPNRVTYRCDGHAGPESATLVKRGCAPDSQLRPDPINAPSDRNVLICCWQPQGDIVIDLEPPATHVALKQS